MPSSAARIRRTGPGYEKPATNVIVKDAKYGWPWRVVEVTASGNLYCENADGIRTWFPITSVIFANA